MFIKIECVLMPRSLKTKSNTFSVCFIYKWKSDFVIQTDFIIFNCLLYTELLPILQIYGDVLSPSNTQLLGWGLIQYDQCLHKKWEIWQPARHNGTLMWRCTCRAPCDNRGVGVLLCNQKNACSCHKLN